jgi:hypothetical protein
VQAAALTTPHHTCILLEAKGLAQAVHVYTLGYAIPLAAQPCVLAEPPVSVFLKVLPWSCGQLVLRWTVA